MKFCEYKRTKSFLTVTQDSFIVTSSNVSSNATQPIVTKFHIELPGAERTRVSSNSAGLPCQHMVNTFKILVFFFRSNWPMALYVAFGT